MSALDTPEDIAIAHFDAQLKVELGLQRIRPAASRNFEMIEVVFRHFGLALERGDYPNNFQPLSTSYSINRKAPL